MAQDSFQDLVNAVMYAESRGQRFDAKTGKLLEGPKTRFGTAKGEMQVLDAVMKKPGYGVKPAADESADERARVGRDLLRMYSDKYGDLDTALAAYNWGPTNTEKWLKAGANPSKLPSETRKYIEMVKSRMTTANADRDPRTMRTSGTVPMPASPKATMSQPSRAPMQEVKVTPEMLEKLGPNYQAALAAMTLADSREDEDEESIAEQYYAEKQAESEREQAYQSRPSALAGLDLTYSSPFGEEPEPVQMADGGFVDPYGLSSGPITEDTRRAMTNVQVPSAREMMSALRRVGSEGVSNFESLARGSVAAIPGMVGDIESIFRDDKNRKFATTSEVEKQYLPQRMTKPTKEAEGFTELGTYVPLPVDPTKVVRGAKAAGKALGPTAAEMLEKITPEMAKPMYIVRPSGGVFPTAKTYTEAPISKLDKEIKDTIDWLNLDNANLNTPERAASAKFLDTKIRNYFKTQAGSVSDPVREALISGRIKIPKDSPLEETFPQSLIDAARKGDVTAMKQLENTLDKQLSLKSMLLGPKGSYEAAGIASEDFNRYILEQMKNNPQIIPDSMLLRLAKKNADTLSPEKSAEAVRDIRQKLANNPTLFNTVFEEKILRLLKTDPAKVITEEQITNYPGLYGAFDTARKRQEGIMALQQNAPITDLEGMPRILGQSFKDIADYSQMIPVAELERMDVPQVINRVIQLKRSNETVEPMVKKAERLVSEGKAVPEKIATHGTKVAIPADNKGHVWREITDPSATLIHAKMLGNSIGGYSRPGTYGSIKKGVSAIANGEVRLFGLYNKDNQLLTNVEYVTKSATGKEGQQLADTITQFFGNGPKTGNVAPQDYVSQVSALIDKLKPKNVPPTIHDLLQKNGMYFDSETRQVVGR